MTDWRSLLNKDNSMRGFEDLKEEFVAALSSEFGIEFDDRAEGIDDDLSDALSDVSRVIEHYTRDWILNLLGNARPEMRVGVSADEMDQHIDFIAEHILDLKENGYLAGEARKGKTRVKPNIAIEDHESLDNIRFRVQTCMGSVQQQLENANSLGI